MDSIINLERVFWVILCVGVIFVAPRLVAARITSSVQHEYNELLESIKLSHQRQLESEKNLREIRLKSALIAELIALWISQPDDRAKLRQLTYEAFLWLPPELANELSDILAQKPGALDVRDYLIKVRKLLLGEADTLEAVKVIHFQLSQYEQTQIKINNPFG